MSLGPYDTLPDVRDGLTRIQRVVLYVLSETAKELGRERVPTVMLYGRVLEHIDLSEMEFQAVLRSLGVADGGGTVRPPENEPGA